MKGYTLTFATVLILLFSTNATAMDFDQLGGVDIHGFISQGYLQSNSNNYLVDSKSGSFEFNEMGINFSSDITDELRIGLQFFAQDIGRVGNDEVTLDWAYGDYRLYNTFGLRAGKFKMAHGLYGETRDIDAVRTSILLPRSVYPIDMRDVFVAMKGVGCYGVLPGGITYQLGYGVIGVQEDSELLSLLAGQAELRARISVYDTYYGLAVSGSAPINPADPTQGVYPQLPPAAASSYAVAVSEGLFGAQYANSTTDQVQAKNAANALLQWQTPLEGLRLGATLVYGTLDMDVSLSSGDSLTIYQDHLSATAVSAEYMLGETILKGEGIVYRIRADLDGTIGGSPVRQEDVRTMGGWYAGLSHRFLYWFEMGGYYSEIYEDIDDRNGEGYEKINLPGHLGWEKDICLSMRFDLNEYWIVKLEGHHIDGTYQMKDAALSAINTARSNGEDPARAVDKDFFLYAAKVSYSF